MTVNQIRDYTALVKRYMNIKSELIERGTPALRSELKEVYEECMNMRSMMGLDTPKGLSYSFLFAWAPVRGPK